MGLGLRVLGPGLDNIGSLNLMSVTFVILSILFFLFCFVDIITVHTAMPVLWQTKIQFNQ